jgi:response regulator RpfG family c-di-GMP phosphodiesterase
MAQAIDECSPYNAHHTRNMARYGRKFIKWLRKSKNAWQPTEEEERGIMLSIWFHDVGKVAVPHEVMDKEDRLGGLKKDIFYRFDIAELSLKLAFSKGIISENEFPEKQKEFAAAREFVTKVNTVGFLDDDNLEKVKRLTELKWIDENGEEIEFFNTPEIEALSIRKGTLTAKERAIIESHVAITARILSEIPFPEYLKGVYDSATSHHEMLNGKGYPRGLKGDEIPRETRLLTIIDIFDALTARDRPYKPVMSLEKAFGILDEMVKYGQIDGDILELFKVSKAYK